MTEINASNEFACNEEGFVPEYLEIDRPNLKTIDIFSNQLHCTNCGALNKYLDNLQFQQSKQIDKNNIDKLLKEMLMILNKCNEEESQKLKQYITQSLNESKTNIFMETKIGNETLIKEYLDNNLNSDIQDQFGNTFVHYASIYGHLGILNILLEHGASVRIKNKNGSTSLHLAASNGHIIILNILLENGALIEATDLDGETPIFYAAINGHKKTVKSLLKNGANINSKNDYLSTPLHIATLCDKPSIVKILLQHGADKNSVNVNHETPLDIAKLRNYEDIIMIYKYFDVS